METNEIIQQWQGKLARLEEAGKPVFDAVFAGQINIGQALSTFEENKPVALSGRVTAKRSHGKVFFMELRDTAAEIQLYVV